MRKRYKTLICIGLTWLLVCFAGSPAAWPVVSGSTTPVGQKVGAAAPIGSKGTNKGTSVPGVPPTSPKQTKKPVKFEPGLSYGASVDYPTSGGSGPVVFADFNSDGNMDIASAVTYLSASGQQTFNTSTGQWVPSSEKPYKGSIHVLYGKSDGTYTAKSISLSGSPDDLVTGDFNKDGKTDLAVTLTRFTTSEYYITHNVLLLNSGNGTLQAEKDITFQAGYQPGKVVAADFNQDGKTDLVSLLAKAEPGQQPAFNPWSFGVAYSDTSELVKYSYYISTRLGNGNGTFGTETIVKQNKIPENITAGDFNGDGKLDLAVMLDQPQATSTSGWGGTTVKDTLHNYTISILSGKGDGTFTGAGNIEVGDSTGIFKTGDINDDGKLDFVSSLTETGFMGVEMSKYVVYLGNGTGNFQKDFFKNDGLANSGKTGQDIAFGDFDGNGTKDLVVTSSTSVAVYPGKGNLTLDNPQQFTIGGNAKHLGTAGLSDDGKDDIIASCGSKVSLLLSGKASSKPAGTNNTTGTNTGTTGTNTVTGTATQISNFSQVAIGTVTIDLNNGSGSAKIKSGLSTNRFTVNLGLVSGSSVDYGNPWGTARVTARVSEGSANPGEFEIFVSGGSSSTINIRWFAIGVK